MALKLYLDTSALLKLYILEPESKDLIARLRRQRGRILVTPLHELELSSAVSQRVFRRESSISERDETLAEFESDLQGGTYVRPALAWASVLAAAARLAKTHSVKTGVRSIDALHVASALASEADRFLTFDKRQHALALAVGLKVGRAPSRR